MPTPINDYTDCVDQRANHVMKLTKADFIKLIEEEMEKPYGDFKIGAMMALINLRTVINELGK